MSSLKSIVKRTTSPSKAATLGLKLDAATIEDREDRGASELPPVGLTSDEKGRPLDCAGMGTDTCEEKTAETEPAGDVTCDGLGPPGDAKEDAPADGNGEEAPADERGEAAGELTAETGEALGAADALAAGAVELTGEALGATDALPAGATELVGTEETAADDAPALDKGEETAEAEAEDADGLATGEITIVEGGKTEEETPDGNTLEGELPAGDGRALEGTALEGTTLDGATLEGRALDGAALDGSPLLGVRLDAALGPIAEDKELGEDAALGAATHDCTMPRSRFLVCTMPRSRHALMAVALDRPDEPIPDGSADGNTDERMLDRAELLETTLEGSALDGAPLDIAGLDGAALDGTALEGAALDAPALDCAGLPRNAAVERLELLDAGPHVCTTPRSSLRVCTTPTSRQPWPATPPAAPPPPAWPPTRGCPRGGSASLRGPLTGTVLVKVKMPAALDVAKGTSAPWIEYNWFAARSATK